MEWVLSDFPKRDVSDGDIRKVSLDVDCVFEWSDKIVSDFDDEGNVIEYTSGYVMKVIPNQSFVLGGEANS